MPSFNVRTIESKLFGTVEADDQTRWFETFAGTGISMPVSIDSTVLDLIADELEIDAEGLVADADRYCQGLFREKAQGLGGSQLGDLGEVLAFLISRAIPGREIVRVVSWKPGKGLSLKGGRFPRPDFIVRENGRSAALEVKTTEAFDFIQLRDMLKKHTQLKPCAAVARCRENALEQLGFVGGNVVSQPHSLKIKGGRFVPFPVGQGIAVAVLATDGRVNSLRSDRRYRTPPACRNATQTRGCWSCVGPDDHIVLVTMPNDPGKLSLAGEPGNGDIRWFEAYQRWARALHSREPRGVQVATSALSTAVDDWVGPRDVPSERAVLKGFWGSYLGDVTRRYGLEIAVPSAFGDLAATEPSFGWERTELPEAPVREMTFDEIRRSLTQPRSVQTQWLAAQVPNTRQETETLSIGVTDTEVRITLLTDAWWRYRAIETEREASSSAARLVSLALTLSGWESTISHMPMKAISASVGDIKVALGWTVGSGIATPDVWQSLPMWPFIFHPRFGLRWPSLLAIGDSRAAVRVWPDGRADLRVSRSAWGE